MTPLDRPEKGTDVAFFFDFKNEYSLYALVESFLRCGIVRGGHIIGWHLIKGDRLSINSGDLLNRYTSDPPPLSPLRVENLVKFAD